MRVVIIEDEPQAVTALKQELKVYCPELQICGVAGAIKQAKDLVLKEKPQLIFLDVQLQDGNGLELLKQLGNYDFKVIFTTAYSQYALDAIKISALDYLLKPIDSHELMAAVEKAQKSSLENAQIRLKNFVSNQGLDAIKKKIAIPTSEGIFLYELESIIRLQSDGNYTKLHLIDDKKLMVAKTLKDFEEILNYSGFMRIHHSHIINLNHLLSYINKDGGYVILLDKTTLPVSKRKKTNLLSFLNNQHLGK